MLADFGLILSNALNSLLLSSSYCWEAKYLFQSRLENMGQALIKPLHRGRNDAQTSGLWLKLFAGILWVICLLCICIMVGHVGGQNDHTVGNFTQKMFIVSPITKTVRMTRFLVIVNSNWFCGNSSVWTWVQRDFA